MSELAQAGGGVGLFVRALHPRGLLDLPALSGSGVEVGVTYFGTMRLLTMLLSMHSSMLALTWCAHFLSGPLLELIKAFLDGSDGCFHHRPHGFDFGFVLGAHQGNLCE